MMGGGADFEAAGLVDGLAGPAREARLALLGRLYDEGVTLDELRLAVADERLALLPVDRVLGGEPRYSADEIAADAGIEPALLVDALAAFGLAPVDPGERRLGEADLAAARRMRAALDAGLPPERIVDVNRVVGRAMAQVAAAIRLLVGEAFMSAGNTEDVAAERLETAARALLPVLGPTLEHAFSLHLRELLRGDAIDAAVLRSGALAGDGPVSVAFADLVGFTWLGGQIPPDELGEVARRLEALTQAARRPNVRLVKTLGDAVMLVSPDATALVATLLELVAAAGAAADEDGFPRVRAGIATGAARERDGDIYGHAVNVASRLTALARPGSVLTDAATHDAVGRKVAWSYAGERRIKGLEEELKVFRARCPPADPAQA
jgi:adenylate cyclase